MYVEVAVDSSKLLGTYFIGLMKKKKRAPQKVRL